MRQKLSFSLVIIVFLLAIIWGIGEIATRIWYKPPSPYFNTAVMDEELGWGSRLRILN